MIELIEGAHNAQASELLRQMFRLRYDVFVTEMRWPLKCAEGDERDQYDTDEAMYLVELDEGREVIASARINQCDKPTMLSDVFADMCEGGPPRGATIWELSRGVIAKRVRRTNNFRLIECGSLEAALLYGVTMGCGLFNVELLAHKISTGLGARHIGPIRKLDGVDCVAAAFPLDSDVLARTRKFYGIDGPVLTRLHLANERRKAA